MAKKRKKSLLPKKKGIRHRSSVKKARPAGNAFFVADALGGWAVLKRQAGGRPPVIVTIYRGRTAASRKSAHTLVKYFRQHPGAALVP